MAAGAENVFQVLLLTWVHVSEQALDFTRLTPGVPGPASNIASYVVPGSILQNVVYRSSDGHLHIQWWTTGGLGHSDLTTAAGTPPAVGDPIAYVNAVNNVEHVIYRATNSHLYDLSWSGPSPVSAIDLTAASGAASAYSDPVGLASPGGLNDVWFYGNDGHLHGLWWTTNAFIGHDDLTRLVVRRSASKPAAYFVRRMRPTRSQPTVIQQPSARVGLDGRGYILLTTLTHTVSVGVRSAMCSASIRASTSCTVIAGDDPRSVLVQLAPGCGAGGRQLSLRAWALRCGASPSCRAARAAICAGLLKPSLPRMRCT